MRVGALHVQQPVRSDDHVAARERGGRIVGGALLALERKQAGRQGHAGRLGIELHDVRYFQQALFCCAEKERSIVLERSAD